MAYSLPTFNLVCNIWRFGNPTSNPPDVTSGCNLTYGRITAASAGGTFPAVGPSNYMALMLPKLTDIRDDPAFLTFDTVEVPAGTGRFYSVAMVDDIGKGFQNEHRAAMILKQTGWPVPIP